MATGVCLRRLQALMEAVAPDAGRMRILLEAGGGVVMAEAASFLLAAQMPRDKAQAIVKQAFQDQALRQAVEASAAHVSGTDVP